MGDLPVPQSQPMRKRRDHKAEYQRRLARAAVRGLSRSQGRGHARSDEKPIRPLSDRNRDALEAALKALHHTNNQGEAARSVGVSAERFRRFLRETGLAQRRGRSWTIHDDRHRVMPVYSKGDVRQRILRGFENASLNGRHVAVVDKAVSTNNPDLLLPFEGLFITDAKGKRHTLETDINVLHRLVAAGSEVFHEIYRLIV